MSAVNGVNMKKTCCWLCYLFTVICICLVLLLAYIGSVIICKLFITVFLFTAVLTIHIIVAEYVQPGAETTNGLQPLSVEGVGGHVA